MTTRVSDAGKKVPFVQDLTAKLCLGTVQFGMQYGINNVLRRQPTDEEVCTVLDIALAQGIHMFDTASAYGTAESILGCYGLVKKKAHIVSKLSPGAADCKEEVLAELRCSLQRLGAEKLFCYMLHRAEDLDRSGIMDGMCTAKERGLTEKIGISVYGPQEAMQAAQDDRIDAIQIPYNVLDQRLDTCCFFELAKKNSKIIFARSAFLQGLLLMNPREAEARVKGSGRLIECFQKRAQESDCSPVEAAMLYALSHPHIDYVVFGVDTPDQLIENIKISKKGAASMRCYQHLQGAFLDTPLEIIQPNLW
jgi:aldo/keto reductase